MKKNLGPLLQFALMGSLFNDSRLNLKFNQPKPKPKKKPKTKTSSKRGRVIHGNGDPYIKPKEKKRTSFTQELRNKKGYDVFLKKRYAGKV